MPRKTTNGNIDLEHYRSKYALLYHVDNENIDHKVKMMLADAIDDQPERFIQALFDARENAVEKRGNKKTKRVNEKKCKKLKTDKMPVLNFTFPDRLPL